MASIALYRKYRPQTFEHVLGQEHVTETVQAGIRDDRIAHAYLFSGPRGTGKTSTARILAKALNCEKGPTPTPCNACETCRSITEGSSLDVIEIDAASHGGVDDVRDLRENALLAPAIARRKVYIIDEAHMVSTQGWNAFLKTVEEPPQHVIFVFATTEPHKVLPTILSRCQRFDFRRVSTASIAEHLAKVCADEGIAADEGALQLIARNAEGGVRDALSTLDQLAATGSVTAKDAARLLGAATTDLLFDFTDALAAADAGNAVRTVASLIEEGHDLRVFAREMLEHLRALLIAKQVGDPGELIDATEETRARIVTQAESISAGKLVHWVRLFSDALADMRQQAAPRLTVELAIVRATMPEVDDTAASALARIERLERILEVGGAPAERPAAPEPPRETPAEEQPARAPAKKTASKKATVSEDPPPPPAATVSDESAPGRMDIERIRRAWTMILEEIRKQSQRVHALVSDASPVAADAQTLSLEHPQSFHAEQLVQSKNASVIAAAVNVVLGVSPKIKATVRPKSGTLEEEDDVVFDAPADPTEIVKAGFGEDVEED